MADRIQFVPNLVPVSQMTGDDDRDIELLRRMSEGAVVYLTSHAWCSAASCEYFGGGIGGIFAVFLCKVDSPSPEVDSWIWAIMGDLPAAYLPLEDAPSPRDVFREYVRGMTKWVELAKQGKTGDEEDDIPPVDLPSTPDWADKIEAKLHLLLLLVKPYFDTSNESAEIN
jgi:hypothetical protein